jgi:hypothetical protein
MVRTKIGTKQVFRILIVLVKKIMMEDNSHLEGLIDHQVSIGISEPWEFEDQVGSSTFTGAITDIYTSRHLRQSFKKETEYLIVHLARPFGYEKLRTEYLIGSPRHDGVGLSELIKGEVVTINFCRASSEGAQSDDLFDSTRWKNYKSFGLIGSIKLKTHQHSAARDGTKQPRRL